MDISMVVDVKCRLNPGFCDRRASVAEDREAIHWHCIWSCDSTLYIFKNEDLANGSRL